jgi:hypothetical protein
VQPRITAREVFCNQGADYNYMGVNTGAHPCNYSRVFIPQSPTWNKCGWLQNARS